ncbi:hypothetical protein NDU88_001098 [Pleurodeles waltl]|uniref:Uncharacterized protein n=1 Tax=Pleurodeles waltl TaxID=8319 RepID=A0AAV7UV83_PLEWA|nr:hypothetical protein NDU88_001098 [Pleurodeles waltl]
MNRIPCRRKHANEDKQEEEAAVAGGERDMHHKQDEKVDAFVEVRDTAQECEEDTERARHVEKLSSFQF